jgi:cobalt-zinc-cadmium efflux system outer membrane protein
MLWRRLSPLALLLGAIGLSGQTAPLATVDQLIEYSLKNNRAILAARQRLEEARALMRQAGFRPAPTLEANAATGRPLGTRGEEEYSIGYFQPIETGGKRSKRISVADRAVALAEAELAERSRQLAYQIKTHYIEAATSQRKSEALERIAGVTRQSYRLVEARVERGDAARLEQQLLLVELNRTESQRVAEAGKAGSGQMELRRVAGIPPAQPLAPPLLTGSSVPASVSLDELQKRALGQRPDLRAAKAQVSQSGAELALEQAQGRPDPTLSAQYALRHAQFEDPIRTTSSGSPLLLKDRDNILTLGVAIPLKTRNRNQGNVDAAAARQRAAQLQLERLEAAIPLEVEAAWQQYQAAVSAVAILNRGVLDESENNLSIIRQAYNLGQLRLLDVLNEQRRLLETELSYIDAQAELAQSRARLELAVGGDLQ